MTETSWGVVYTTDIPHSNGWQCESDNCNFKLSFNKESFSHLVGIRENKLIYRCPKCFALFWVHLSRDTFVGFAKQWCPNFPKKLKITSKGL